MTRYREAFSWTRTIGEFLEEVVRERPLLNVCSGREPFGDVTADLYEAADVKARWTMLPFRTDSFGAVFADPPWDGAYKRESALFVREALRVAPVAYVMSPWFYGGQDARLTRSWLRELPGIANAIVLCRYERGWRLAQQPAPWAELDQPARSKESAPRLGAPTVAADADRPALFGTPAGGGAGQQAARGGATPST